MELTREEFNQDASALAGAFEGLRGKNSMFVLSNWQLKYKDKDNLYLLHPPVTTNLCDTRLSITREEESSLEDQSVTTDPQQFSEQNSTENTVQKRMIRWIFSVLYSETYRVPVLYFHAEEDSGELCTREHVLDWLHPKDDVKDTWDFISQEEHPFTSIPSFFLHPCRTSTRLGLLFKPGDISVIWAWMSMILPVVNYSVPPSFFICVQNEIQSRKERRI